MGTDLARRALARPDALTPTLAPRVARSLARFYYAQAFNQDIDAWDTSSVRDMSFMWVLTSPAVRSPAPTRSPSLRASLARQVLRRHCLQPDPEQLEHEFGDGNVLHVGTDLARRARARPDALTPTLAPRVARSLVRFSGAKNFNQALNSWDTSSVTSMSYMWVLTSPAVRSPAPTRSRPRSLRASLARSPGSITPRSSIRTSAAGS